ncbi:MAG: M14 family zinc carboxypeptidase [Terriglobales bacterium]
MALGLGLGLAPALLAQGKPSPDFAKANGIGPAAGQAVDQAYTAAIRKDTTEPYFSSPLVDYLPSSKTVPTPEAVLGDIAGAPNILPHSAEVYKYMRMLAAATPRVRVYTIGHSIEGREQVAVAVTSAANFAKLDANRALLAQLADPRTLQMNDARANQIAREAVPVYYITGTIHSTETGAPTALMEMAYRLAVDDSPYIQYIRDHEITLITPIVEVDGRDRMADLYKWHRDHLNEDYPHLVYWGHYVAHDNNRDSMAMTLPLSRNVLNTLLSWHAQVLHDLHESEPYLYDNTAGDGPFNAWVDPILANEWEILAWNNVQAMGKFGMPGVYTHGNFDTWSPGYLMFLAALHNGISRLYETFGNGGADTEMRTLSKTEYSRTWYRQNPPLPRVLWSQRDNNNYEETGLLTSLHFFAENRVRFLEDFYLKSKDAVAKPKLEGPAAYVLSAADPRPQLQSELLQAMQYQHVEISRATQAFSVAGATPGAAGQQFPAGSYILRMDQPYSRIADSLLDVQYWAPNDPQRTPYDDTGWTFGAQFNTSVARVTDPSVLTVPMERVTTLPPGGAVEGSGPVYALNDTADTALARLRYRLPNANISIAEEPFDAAGHHFNRGSFVIQGLGASDLETGVKGLQLTAYSLEAAPSVAQHAARAARVAILHTWTSTQTEGWWREALDYMHIPHGYISTQTVGQTPDLRAQYDVILFPPGAGSNVSRVVNGSPMWGNALPWQHTAETPALGILDSTPDMRPGMGWQGVANLQKFVEQGGVLVTTMDTADLAVALGLTHGVSSSHPAAERIIGTVVQAQMVDASSPIAYGYGDKLALYCYQCPAFGVSNVEGGRGGGRRLGAQVANRPTGRGSDQQNDFVVGRVNEAPPVTPSVQPWQAAPVSPEQAQNNEAVIPPAYRPRVVLRYADARHLLISGLVQGAASIADHPAVVDDPVGQGHVVMFSDNPVYRGETRGDYAMVLNTILNFDHLNAGRPATAAPAHR